MVKSNHTGPNIIDLHDQVIVTKTKQIGLVVYSEIITVVYVQTSGMQKTKVTEYTVKFADQSTECFLSHELDHNDDEIECECDECDGDGTVEMMQECGRVASMCCGGCYVDVECDQCNGTGTIEKQIDEIIEL